VNKLNRLAAIVAEETGENVLKIKRRLERAAEKHPARVREMENVLDKIENLEREG
jgi:hypothetical protein